MRGAKKKAPGQSPEKKNIDPRVAAILAAIDVRRQELGIKTLEKLAELAKGRETQVSTWHGWRGEDPTSPKFVDLDDFASAVGLRVGLISDDVSQQETSNMSAKTRAIATLVEMLDDKGRDAVFAFVEQYRKMWGGSSNPQ